MLPAIRPYIVIVAIYTVYIYIYIYAGISYVHKILLTAVMNL